MRRSPTRDTRRVTRLAVVACSLALGACTRSGPPSGADPPGVSYDAGPPMGPCAAVEQQQALEGEAHVALCSPVAYRTKPPSSGNHYSTWAAYKTYASPVPEGYWVHDLEHGAVVISYACAGGCADQIAAAEKMIASLPEDPACLALGQHVQRRFILTPDPKLDIPFAASAWGWTLRASCFDAAAFSAFVTAHYARSPEDLCDDGEDVASAGLVPSCGEATAP